jgi:hypothetical protein
MSNPFLDQIDAPKGKPAQGKTSPAQLVERFVLLQGRADSTGIPQDVWDEYGYIGTCFPCAGKCV